MQNWLGTLDIIFPIINHEILFGVTSSESSDVINYITLCGKYFIWKSKQEKIDVSFVHFKQFLHSKLKYLNDTLIYRGQIDKFNPYINVFNCLANSP